MDTKLHFLFHSMPAPIDEISGEYVIPNYENWKKKVYKKSNTQFGTRYGDVTFEKLASSENEHTKTYTDEIEYKYWSLKRIENRDERTGKVQHRLILKGNPAKEIYNGKNIRHVTYFQFLTVLLEVCDMFCIDIEKVKIIAPIEPSLTLNPSSIVDEATLRNRFKVFQGRELAVMLHGNTGAFMGYVCSICQSEFKGYLPSVKFGMALNSFRVESRYKKSYTFRRATGLKYWGDFFNMEKLYRCFKIILDLWDDVIIIDPTLKKSVYNKHYINEMILKGADPQYWIDEFPNSASDKTCKKRLEEYRLLSYERGEGLHTEIRKLIKNEQEKFRNVSTWVTGYKSEISEAEGMAIAFNSGVSELRELHQRNLELDRQIDELFNNKYNYTMNNDQVVELSGSIVTSEELIISGRTPLKLQGRRKTKGNGSHKLSREQQKINTQRKRKKGLINSYNRNTAVITQ